MSETKSIDFIPERTAEVFHASQNDSGRVIRCSLFDGTSALTLAGTEDIRVRYRKPNGNINSFGVTNTSSNYVDVTLPDDLTAIAGRVYCKLRIDGVGCKAFYVDVERGA